MNEPSDRSSIRKEFSGLKLTDDALALSLARFIRVKNITNTLRYEIAINAQSERDRCSSSGYPSKRVCTTRLVISGVSRL